MKPYYQDSAVTIYLGDCREIVPTLGRFDLLLTDPPFGISFAAQPTKWQRQAGQQPETWDDERPSAELIAVLRSYADTQVIWGGNYFAHLLPPSRGWFAWCKADAPPSMGNLELAWTNADQNAKHFDWSISATNGERVGHPTQKPLALMSWCLSFFPDAQTVLDPFAGSGTTGRACKDLGRKCVLIEREERYAEICARRMGQEVLALT